MRSYVYSYWSECDKIIDDLENPIIISTATLRHKTKDKIIVFDYSNVDWQDYPKKLNLNIIKKQPSVTDDHLSFFQKNIFSRNIDLFDLAKSQKEQEYVSVDSDIFWLDCVSDNLNKNKFHIKGGDAKMWVGFNNGCYIFNKTGDAFLFMEIYVNKIKKFIQDRHKFTGIRHEFCNDESICYQAYCENKHLCENNFIYNGILENIEPNWNQKNVHAVHSWLIAQAMNMGFSPVLFKQKCGLIAFLIKETNLAIEQTLPDFYAKIKTEGLLIENMKKIILDGKKKLIEKFNNICLKNL